MISAPADALPVLVVDDDSALIRTLADILRINGYAPSTAETAREGLALAERTPPMLAVVDLRLPDMDGVELAARLHALSELTEVVVLTGNASMESAVAALREHSIDYLLKPVKVEHLLHVASVATERWQRRHAEAKLRDSVAALEARARQQEAVAGFGQRALVTDNLNALFEDSVRLVTEILDLPFGAVLERKSDGKALQLRAGFGWKGGGTADVPVEDYGWLLREHGIASGTTVVIPGGVKPYGVLGAHDTREREFSRDDVHFLQAIAHIVGTAVDRSRTEAAFRQAQRLEAVGRLAGGVAHDFNNMLTAIIDYGEMIRAALPAGDSNRDDVEEILKAAGRAASLTRQLLAFSRQQVLQPRLVNLNDIVTDMEKMIRRLIGEDIEFTTLLASDLGWAKADPGQIEQVILNLCVNARDALPNGGRMTIETANAEADLSLALEQPGDAQCDYVMLAVSDTGIGMDAETKARIYEPFFSTKEPDKGTGLGLSTVYGIVKQSGGDIWVYSELGQGTTFKVFLPRLSSVSGEHRVSDKRAVAAGGHETVLLAEDEDSVRRLAQRLLEKAGYSVLPAKDGVEAQRLSEAHQGPIHLLVTDMVMPTMNGRQLAQQLRATRPAMRVLYLSGYTDSTVARQGLLDDAANFLQKPFSNDSLSRKVREVLDESPAAR